MNDVRSRHLLPARAYIGAEWFEREREQLFGRVWAFACMEEDAPEPGDYVCVDAGRFPLIVVRDAEGQLRAFHNVCRHRGTRLLEGTGNTGTTITCFYHAWSYNLGGELVGVPQEKSQFPGLERSRFGLRPAKLETWMGLVFVHPNPGSGALEEWLARVPEMQGAHDPRTLVEASRISYRIRANWKIVIENFIDGYHFFYLHKSTLGDGDFHKQKWAPEGRHWTFYRPLKNAHLNDTSLLPLIEGVEPDFGVGAFVLFPNLAVYQRGTFWLTFHVKPRAVDESDVEIRLRAEEAALANLQTIPPVPDNLPASVIDISGHLMIGPNVSDAVHPLESDDVMLEDIYACEAVQAGMNSPAFVAGPLSKHENALVFFQKNVLDFVGEGAPATAPERRQGQVQGLGQGQEVAPGITVIHGPPADAGDEVGDEVAPGITVTRVSGSKETPE